MTGTLRCGQPDIALQPDGNDMQVLDFDDGRVKMRSEQPLHCLIHVEIDGKPKPQSSILLDWFGLIVVQ